MKQEQIKKCKCGATPSLWVDYFDPVDFGHLSLEYFASCSNPKCNIIAEYAHTREEAIRNWNRLVGGK